MKRFLGGTQILQISYLLREKRENFSFFLSKALRFAWLLARSFEREDCTKSTPMAQSSRPQRSVKLSQKATDAGQVISRSPLRAHQQKKRRRVVNAASGHTDIDYATCGPRKRS